MRISGNARIRGTVLLALALATAGALASPALAGTTSSAKAVHARASGFNPPSAIPWDSVGTGWLLTSWTPGINRPGLPEYLVLADQAGQRFIVLRQTGALAHAALLGWTGDGRSALFDTQTMTGRTKLYVVDLRTGVISAAFVVPTSASNNWQGAGFTRPDGLGLVVSTYVDNHYQLTRYSLGGEAQTTYPTTFAGLGTFGGTWLYSPNGTELVLGTGHGLAIVTNSGATVARLPLAGSHSCTPDRWWSPTVVLAACFTGPHQESRLYEFHTTGAPAVALTQNNVGTDDGDIAGWRVSGHVYVEVASACGYVYLAKLKGNAPVMVQIPGVSDGHSEYVRGATGPALAIQTSIACSGHTVLLWYRPAKNQAQVVFGPPIVGGSFGTVLTYPSPTG